MMIQYNNMKPNPFGLRFTGKFTLKHIHLQIKRGKTYPAECLHTVLNSRAQITRGIILTRHFLLPQRGYGRQNM